MYINIYVYTVKKGDAVSLVCVVNYRQMDGL